MATAVQIILKQKIAALGISGNALAKKAGIPVSSLKNILQGKVESPRAQTMHALARALHCSVEELMFLNSSDAANSSDPSAANGNPDSNEAPQFDAALYSEAIQLVSDSATTFQLTLNREQAIRFAECVYDYAMSAARNTRRPARIERAFILWLLEREKMKNPVFFLRPSASWKRQQQSS